MRNGLFALALTGAALAALPAASEAQTYGIQALSTPGSIDVTPSRISGSYISGNATLETGNAAVVYGPSGTTILQPPTGGFVQGVSGVNRLGHAVGVGSPGNTSQRALLWKDGVVSVLPMSDSNGNVLYGARATAINDAGTVIGGGETPYGSLGVIWKDGNIQFLRGLTPDADTERSAANAINAAGLVAGSAGSGANGNVRSAVVWEDGTARVIAGLGSRSAAYGINDFGTSVGYTVTEESDSVAFVNNGLTTTFLPDLSGMVSSSALAINNAGLVVGFSSPDGFGEGVATLWRNGVVYDLNTMLGAAASDWQLTGATGIGDDGTVIGYGFYRGEYAGFKMSPVPEPASMVALGLGFAALVKRRRKA